jgi:hypothetical protein
MHCEGETELLGFGFLLLYNIYTFEQTRYVVGSAEPQCAFLYALSLPKSVHCPSMSRQGTGTHLLCLFWEAEAHLLWLFWKKTLVADVQCDISHVSVHQYIRLQYVNKDTSWIDFNMSCLLKVEICHSCCRIKRRGLARYVMLLLMAKGCCLYYASSILSK